EGRIILSPRNSGLSNYETLAEVPGLTNRARTLLNPDKENKLSYQRDGKTYFINSRWVPELNWFLIVEQSENELLSPLRNTLALNILLALVITLIVSGM